MSVASGSDAAPQPSRLRAPQAWQTIDFISDLHLQADDPGTFEAWQDYLRRTRAQAVFMLGDLFEVWVGDDAAQAPAGAGPGFEARCAKVLGEASQRRALHFIAGNRDFLLGEEFARRCGLQRLADPCVLDFAGQRWLLSHGDALCLDDKPYMQFRAQVRSLAWQRDFLARPLAERRAIAQGLRAQSKDFQRTLPSYIDPDPAATVQWLNDAGSTTLIHGHTHRPREHALDGGCRRIVLSDWDLLATPPRAEVLRLRREPDGEVTIRRIAPDQA